MTSATQRVDALLNLANHARTPIEEAETAYRAAVSIIERRQLQGYDLQLAGVATGIWSRRTSRLWSEITHSMQDLERVISSMPPNSKHKLF